MESAGGSLWPLRVRTQVSSESDEFALSTASATLLANRSALLDAVGI